MTTKFIKFYHVLITIFIVSFAIAYITCGFFDSRGQDIVAHTTGMITMAGCFTAGFSFLKFLKKNLMFTTIGFIANIGMALAYFLYIFKEISPSNVILKSHAASSMLFDVTTLLLSVTTLFALVILNKEDKKND